MTTYPLEATLAKHGVWELVGLDAIPYRRFASIEQGGLDSDNLAGEAAMRHGDGDRRLCMDRMGMHIEINSNQNHDLIFSFLFLLFRSSVLTCLIL